MRNRVEQGLNGLLGQTGLAGKGATTHGAAIQLQRNTATAINADHDAASNALKAMNAGRRALRTQYQTLRAERKKARNLARLVREMMRETLGSTHSVAWSEIGFSKSLALPRRDEDLEVLLEQVQQFFADNPPHEVPSKNITFAEAEMRYDRLKNARAAVAEAKSDVKELTQVRNEKFAALRKRMRGLMLELTDLLDPLDARWSAFGLNQPGAKQTPDVPENVVAVLVGPNAISVKWDAAARAEYYRVWTKVGAAETFTAVGSPADFDFTIENVPANAVVEIGVTAVNNGGESQLSKIRSVTTPAAAIA